MPEAYADRRGRPFRAAQPVGEAGKQQAPLLADRSAVDDDKLKTGTLAPRTPLRSGSRTVSPAVHPTEVTTRSGQFKHSGRRSPPAV